MTQIKISNAGGTLECDAIKWAERQSCNPAIRQIPPSSSGEFVDTGTFVMDNRKLTIIIHLTDAQRDTLNNIFNANATVTATVTIIAKTESGQDYPRWVYRCWLSEILNEYSYSKEGTNEREWLVTIKFICKNYTYYSGDEMAEGDYSTWTAKWNTSVTDIQTTYSRAIINVDGDEVFFVSYNRGYWLKLSTGELVATIDTLYYGSTYDYVASSIRGKYLVVADTDGQTIHIYKDGVLKQTITPVAGDFICGVSINSDGKYIVVGLRDADKVYCYEALT